MTLEDDILDVIKVEHFDHQVSRVTFPNGSMLGVNRWEIEGEKRLADGFTNPQFRLIDIKEL